MDDKNKSLDLLGVKPIADSVNKVTDGAVNGASAFLSRICLPAAEEFGLLLKDKVSSWRAKNAVDITNKAQALLLDRKLSDLSLHALPRIVYSVIENGSWADDDLMQNLWAGLLASSCSETGKDESNLILVNLLSQLTTSQVRLISHISQNAASFQTEAGWIGALPFYMELEDLIQVMKVEDIHQIDRELDHLRGSELIGNGFSVTGTRANVTPNALCLQLYARCQGYIGNPCDFFNSPITSKVELMKAFQDSEKDF
jgi:hypothetical protein